jgi:hypothetical protein
MTKKTKDTRQINSENIFKLFPVPEMEIHFSSPLLAYPKSKSQRGPGQCYRAESGEDFTIGTFPAPEIETQLTLPQI